MTNYKLFVLELNAIKKMKKISLWSLLMLLMVTFTACSDFDPKGMPELPDLPKVSNLQATPEGFNVNLSWTLPTGTEEKITGVKVIPNGQDASAVVLDADATSYVSKGQPMGQDYFYTVKLIYNDEYMSEGVSVEAVLPMVELPNVTGVTSDVNGRTVTLRWTLPQHDGITGVRVVREGDDPATYDFEGAVTEAVLKAQPMDQTFTYKVQVVYETYYAASGVEAKATIPYITPKMGYLMTASSPDALPDDDERAAAKWFSQQENAEFITPAQLADIDVDLYPVLWVEIDRVGLPLGWENLPQEFINDEALNALKNYTRNGGNLFLANMATQLTVPLGVVPADMAPTVYGNGDGGSGDDTWVLNAYLGWDFKDGSDQGFYDRTGHAIYEGLTFSDVNGYGYQNLPLIGPGQREDHNCMWDCNIYGRGNYPDVIKNFEVTTNCMVLATWGHVRDHCVAALVDFNPNAEHGRVIANGLAAYEWNQNSGANPYQGNIERLTLNILNYLK